MKPRNTPNLQTEVISGLSAGVTGTFIGYPLDLVKTRMQTQPIPSSTSSVCLAPGLSTMRHTFHHILKFEGASSLFKGLPAPLLATSLLSSITFSSYNVLRSTFHAQRGWDTRNALAATLVGPIASLISTVEHFTKVQLQLDNVTRRHYQGSWQCVSSNVRNHGVGILYTGYWANCLRESVFLGIYFYLYEGLRWKFTSNGGARAVWGIPLAGGLSGSMAWFLSFPFDFVKTQIQSQPLRTLSGSQATTHVPMKNSPTLWRMVLHLCREKGLLGLYAGVTPTVLRSFMVSATRFSVYELVKGACEKFEVV